MTTSHLPEEKRRRFRLNRWFKLLLLAMLISLVGAIAYSNRHWLPEESAELKQISLDLPKARRSSPEMAKLLHKDGALKALGKIIEEHDVKSSLGSLQKGRWPFAQPERLAPQLEIEALTKLLRFLKEPTCLPADETLAARPTISYLVAVA